MDDMRAMMQDELRQALAGLLPPLAAAPAPAPAPIVAPIPTTVIPPVAANSPAVDAPPANNDNTGG